MARLHRMNKTHVRFKCPGCGEWHVMRIDGQDRPRWEWNHSLDAPTLSPSILFQSGHYASHYRKGDPCWCDRDHPDDFNCVRCHSYVRDGRIQFLSDCTHALAGQTVDLPAL